MTHKTLGGGLEVVKLGSGKSHPEGSQVNYKCVMVPLHTGSTINLRFKH